MSQHPMLPVSVIPERLDTACRDGRAKIYDECSDQRDLFAIALQRAKTERKVLLVSYGAEWCIWCHVFEAYISGEHDAFSYELPDETRSMRERRTDAMVQEAAALNRFVSETFVVLHLESDHAPGGWEVLETTGADSYLGNWVPFIFTIADDQKIAATLDHEKVELATSFLSNYRGYNRAALLSHLQKMAEAARNAGQTAP